jgi:hypothetical protein
LEERRENTLKLMRSIFLTEMKCKQRWLVGLYGSKHSFFPHAAERFSSYNLTPLAELSLMDVKAKNRQRVPDSDRKDFSPSLA